MKKILLMMFTLGLLASCQSTQMPDDQYSYVTSTSYRAPKYFENNNPNWQSAYRVNSSNYYGNPNFERPDMIY